MAESRFAVALEIKRDIQNCLGIGANDKARQKELEMTIAQLETKRKQLIDEAKNTQVNPEILHEQLKLSFDKKMRDCDRLAEQNLEHYEQSIADKLKEIEDAKQELIVLEKSIKKARENILGDLQMKKSMLQKEFQKEQNELRNTDKAKDLEIRKINALIDKEQSMIQVELNRLKIKNEIAQEQLDNLKSVYNDIIEIGKNMDIKKTQ